MKRYIATVSALTLFAAVANAQTAPTEKPAQNQSSTPSTMQSTSKPDAAKATQPKGITMADTATYAVRFVSPAPADFMTSKLVGVDVYNNQNEKLGEIEDIAIKDGSIISGVVISVGGFLGVGERYVLVDPASLVINHKDRDWRAFIDTSKDTLKNAPKFTYERARS